MVLIRKLLLLYVIANMQGWIVSIQIRACLTYSVDSSGRLIIIDAAQPPRANFMFMYVNITDGDLCLQRGILLEIH